MTGEMGWSDLKDYPDMLKLAASIQRQVKVAAQLRPFDVYQGPFIAVDLDMSRANPKSRLSSWNLEVWMGEGYGMYVVNHNHKWSKNLTSTQVLKIVRDAKLKWRK